MSQPQPPFHDLTFSVDAPFWGSSDVSERRVHLMPSPHNPAEFLAFGVVGSPDKVVFVARGPVATRLAAFIDRMQQDEARVELHARAPVPGHVIQPHIGGGPWEGQVVEEPPRPPSGGRIALSTDPALTTDPQVTSPVPLWPDHSARDATMARLVYILTQPGSSQFVAFGVFMKAAQAPSGTQDAASVDLTGVRAPFVARGQVGTALDEFIVRVKNQGAQVVSVTTASALPQRLRTYVSTYAKVLN
jgi:hypothetical protein